MNWVAKQSPSKSEVARAYALLPPNPAWQIGVIETDGHVQYRGAMHPNKNTPGTHAGVEVWTDIEADQYKQGVTMPEDLGTTTPAEREQVLAAAEAQGYPRDEVEATVQIESAWKPHNWYHGMPPDKAGGGLIGFMPSTLKLLGWPSGGVAFRAQSSGEQAKWVGAFFGLVKGKWKYPGDTYVAIAATSFVGRPDSTPVYKQGSKAYELNRIWDTNKDGVITVGDLRQVLLSRMGKGTPATDDPKARTGTVPEVRRVYYLSLSARVSPWDLYSVHEGDRDSTHVRIIQSALKTAGAYEGKIDGDYGPITQLAIERFLNEAS